MKLLNVDDLLRSMLKKECLCQASHEWPFACPVHEPDVAQLTQGTIDKVDEP